MESSSSGVNGRRTFPGSPMTIDPGGTTSPSGTSVPAATIDPVPIRHPFNRMAPIPMRHRSSMVHPWTHRAMSHRHIVTDYRRIGVAHHVHEGQVLDIGPRADAHVIDVAANDDVHPHAALRAEQHVTDDLRTGVHERRGMDRRVHRAVRAKHSLDYKGGFITSSQVAADGAAPFAPQARGPRRARLRGGVEVPRPRRMPLAPSTNGAAAVRTRLEVMNRFYSFGSVSPCWPWYLPFLSA